MLKGKQLLCILLSAVLLIVSAGPVFAAENEPAIPQEQAAEVTRVEEIVAWRETDSETYLLSDGTYECVIYAGDKYYRDATNTLQLIDNSIILDAETAQTTNRQYKNAANSFALSFSESEKPRITLEQSGKSLSFSAFAASGGNSNHITMDDTVVRIGGVQNCAILSEMTDTGDNTITYPNAFYNSDLVYVVKDHALKEYIILENSYAPNTFSFLFEMEGLTLDTDGDSACFTDAAGNPVFALDDLFAVDANGVFTEELTYDFFPVKDTGDVIVTVILDETYLQSEDRAFPVVIDPTLMISSIETADACVCSNHPNTNYRNAFQLRTGYDGNDYGIRRSYIRFNLPDTIPVGSVTNARLDVEKVSGVAPTIKAYRCAFSWSSSSITWHNQPDDDVRYAWCSSLSVPYRTGSNWYVMNVTGIVQSWVNGSYENYGFILEDNTENNPSHWTTLYSSDADSPHKPELHITYGGDTIPITQSSSTTQYMSAGNSYIYSFVPMSTSRYSIWTTGSVNTTISVYNDSALSNYMGGSISGGHLNNACVTVNLSSGMTYYIVVVGADASTTGSFTLKLYRGLPMSGSELPNYISTYNSSTYQMYTNCYAYALGIWKHPLTGSLFDERGINPGELAGNSIIAEDLANASTAKAAIVSAVKADCVAMGGSTSDFYEVGINEMVPQGYYKVALVLKPGIDYHWYRQTSDLEGRWAHKQGVLPATEYDVEQNYIYIPSEAYPNGYTEFLGYFALKPPVSTTSVSMIANYALEATNQTGYAINQSVSTNQFYSFKAGETTEAQVRTLVGDAHEYMGSGFVWDIYTTTEGDTIAITYRNGLVQEVRKINASTGAYEIFEK